MIDWARVETLRDEVGEDSFAEVVALFLDEVDEVADRFRATPDASRLERDLHFLKGSALNLGFARLGELCQTGERLAAEGKAALVDMAEILAVYAESRRVFVQALGIASAA
jgi:HPt (histidine-containing phosphotransfer) domain-containing protein